MTELKTLYHRNDPATSREAAKKMIRSEELNRQEEGVLKAIKMFISYRVRFKRGETFTPKEIPYLDYYVIQRRLSGLHRKGKIERIQATDRGELLFNKKGKPIWITRDSCCVWRLTNG